MISALPATSLLEELADIREQVAVQAPVRVRSKVHHDLLDQLGVVAEPETARALEVLARRVEKFPDEFLHELYKVPAGVDGSTTQRGKALLKAALQGTPVRGEGRTKHKAR